jgi:hypothetical protein
MTIRSKQRHSASSEQRAEIAELRGRYDLLTHREHKLDTCETTVKIHRGQRHAQNAIRIVD